MLAVGDVNNDALIDIVIVSGDPSDIYILLGYGNGSFQALIKSSVRFGTGYGTSSVVGDFTNDARLDIVMIDSDGNTRSFFIGYGNGSFVEKTTFPVGCGPTYVTAADFNNDAQLDIVTVNLKTNDISVLLGYKCG